MVKKLKHIDSEDSLSECVYFRDVFPNNILNDQSAKSKSSAELASQKNTPNT